MRSNRPQRSRRQQMLLAAVAALMIGLGGNAQAGYSDSQAAFERQDYSTALYELEPLAAQGDGRAQYLVGIIHRDGLGVQPDYVTAYAWLHVAAARGQPQAASARDGMSWRLTPSGSTSSGWRGNGGRARPSPRSAAALQHRRHL
jgi:TPR repeat protein